MRSRSSRASSRSLRSSTQGSPGLTVRRSRVSSDRADFNMGNWGPELVACAGGTQLLGTPGAHSTTTRWEAVRDADPDYLLVAPCGFGLERTLSEMHVMEALPGWRDLRAVREGRVFVADGDLYFNRSSPSVFKTSRFSRRSCLRIECRWSRAVLAAFVRALRSSRNLCEARPIRSPCCTSEVSMCIARRSPSSRRPTRSRSTVIASSRPSSGALR